MARIGRKRGAYSFLVRKLEGDRLPGRPNRRWDDNIKTNLQEVGWRHGLFDLA